MKSQNQGLNLFLAIVLTALIVGGIMHYVNQAPTTDVEVEDTLNEDTESQDSENSPEDQSEVETETSEDNTPEQTSMPTIVSSQDDEYRELVADVPTYVVSALNVQPYTGENAVYLTGQGGDETQVIRYNLDDTQDQKTVAFTKDFPDMQWRIVAIEDTKLILMVEPVDFSPNPCFQFFSYSGKFQTLDLQTFELSDYTPSAELVAKADADAETCMESL